MNRWTNTLKRTNYSAHCNLLSEQSKIFNNECFIIRYEKYKKVSRLQSKHSSSYFRPIQSIYSVSHETLLKKLQRPNFDEIAIKMIKNFLTERYQMIKVSTCSSDWIKLYQGVPHGTVFVPFFATSMLMTCNSLPWKVVIFFKMLMILWSLVHITILRKLAIVYRNNRKPCHLFWESPVNNQCEQNRFYLFLWTIQKRFCQNS